MTLPTPWIDDTLAPNGKPVRENFAAWFGDSRAANEDGTPLKLFHGTGAEFSAFKDNTEGAHFFSTSEATATWFAENGDERRKDKGTPRVLPVYLSISNPMVLSYDDLYNRIGIDWDDPRPEDPHSINWPSLTELVNEAKQEGCDGLWLIDIPEYNGEIADQWVAFEPHQIKSAVKQVGTYDLACSDIHGKLQAARCALGYLQSLQPVAMVRP